MNTRNSRNSHICALLALGLLMSGQTACSRDSENMEVFLTGAPSEQEENSSAENLPTTTSQNGMGTADDDAESVPENNEGDSTAENQSDQEVADTPEGGAEKEDDLEAKFDVPSKRPEDGICAEFEAGIHCKNNHDLFECGADGTLEREEDCAPTYCVEGVGCQLCSEGQIACKGNQVLECDTSVPGHTWKLLEVCDSVARERCDYESGSCVAADVTGSDAPTGEYYQYAAFKVEDYPLLNHAADVDSYSEYVEVEGKAIGEQKIYTTKYQSSGGDTHIYVWDLDILDSDGDGKIEFDQHPDNPEYPGVIEERALNFDREIHIPADRGPSLFPHQGEIYALKDRLFYLGHTVEGTVISEYDFATETVTEITKPAGFDDATFGFHPATMGYDHRSNTWYGLPNSEVRDVWQYDIESQSWGIAFTYPPMAGVHSDGMEVVEDPNTGKSYVYVSDMTSNFILQYELDLNRGWVQKNVFEYNEPEGTLVEGMGYGAFGHFWAGSWKSTGTGLYELGGGALAEFTQPVD